ncbi:unnamed protein product [Caenorhabditis brenneri]
MAFLKQQEEPVIPPRKRELHPIGIDKEKGIKVEPAHRETITKGGHTEQLDNYKKMEEEDAKKDKEFEMKTRAAMKFGLANYRRQEKQAILQDQILKDIGANLEPDCSHPRFPVMIVEKGNGDLASITSVKEFNEVRKEEFDREPPKEKRRRMELRDYLNDSDSGSDNDDGLDDVVEVEVEDEEEEEEEDDGNDIEEEEAPLLRHGRLLEMMMRDVIRDDDAHPDGLRGAANDLPNVMQRLENMMERQNRQREAMRNEIVAARGFLPRFAENLLRRNHAADI